MLCADESFKKIQLGETETNKGDSPGGLGSTPYPGYTVITSLETFL